MIKNLHKFLFYLLVFLVPLNLGKHFVYNWSYVHGLLVDYLVPTVYVTDLLLVLVLAFWLITFNKEEVKRTTRLLNEKGLVFLFLFFVSLGFSIAVASEPSAALYMAFKHILYGGLFLYVLRNFDTVKDFSRIARIFSISVFLLSILAFAQWFSQGSLFDNYLVFGEQPYSTSTPGIVKESFFGNTVVPSYGIFRHPNIFAGFLSIALLYMLVLIPEDKFALLSFALGCVALLLTFSKFTWLVFAFSLVVVLFIKWFGKPAKDAILALSILVFVLLFFLSIFSTNDFVAGTRSLSRRADLLSDTYTLVRDNILFGVGPGGTYEYVKEWRFIQPVHNVFVLVLAESGIFALLFFSLFIFATLKKAYPKDLLLIILLQVLLLAGFDHFFYTINQAQLLFWLTLGIIYTYNLKQ